MAETSPDTPLWIPVLKTLSVASGSTNLGSHDSPGRLGTLPKLAFFTVRFPLLRWKLEAGPVVAHLTAGWRRPEQPGQIR
jgi:hypothetical protein